jgi:glycosyltransferase involved in cell wall biosynthesis
MKIVDRESVVISFLVRANILSVILKKYKKCSVILTEGTQLSKAVESPFKSCKSWMIKHYYKKADLIIVNSKGIKSDLERHFNIPASIVKVIYNSIDLEEIVRLAHEPLEHECFELFQKPVIITLGRLTKAKGHYHLIRIFKEIKKSIPDIKLIIISDGELRDYLIDLSKNLGLKVYSAWYNDRISCNSDIFFFGYVDNPFKYLSQAKLFVFTSVWEGLPYTLIEAMTCGLPVISSDCRSGPRELLAPSTNFEHETKSPEFSEYGVLMPVCTGDMKSISRMLSNALSKEETEWSDMIIELLNNRGMLHKYIDSGRQRIKDFSADTINRSWQEVMTEFLHSVKTRSS